MSAETVEDVRRKYANLVGLLEQRIILRDAKIRALRSAGQGLSAVVARDCLCQCDMGRCLAHENWHIAKALPVEPEEKP